jgi:hypothetical protein
MKKLVLTAVALALICSLPGGAYAAMNHNGKFGLHLAGPHDSKANTCDYVMMDCLSAVTHVVTPMGSRWDIYVIAMDVVGIQGVRYGLRVETALGPGLLFYGWTNCGALEIPTPGWPGHGEGNAQTWFVEQPGPHVTVGILDLYVYPGTNAKICTAVDPRVGFSEFCDGDELSPLCNKHYADRHAAYGCVGFNRLGYNPCEVVPEERTTWGLMKAIYR